MIIWRGVSNKSGVVQMVIFMRCFPAVAEHLVIML